MIDYDSHHWREHLWDIKGSMVRQIFYRVLTCVAWAVVVATFNWFYPFQVNPLGHTLIGVALGLLLVFRTNASYDRFWEGRKAWGAIVNDSRNLARSTTVLLKDDPAIASRVVHWTVAFAAATMHRLRGDKGLGPIGIELPEDEVREALAANHVPLAVACRISEQLYLAHQEGLISDYVQMTLDQNVQRLVDSLGVCERIHLTPLPFAYVVHLRRALIVYCFTLPLVLVGPFGPFGEVLATLLIAYTLYGVEEIGVQIEDPFGLDDNDLPLEQICSTIQANLTSLLRSAIDATP